ncbi:ACBP-domain-containing protein [Obba rivulosa]|uniref:ACBP-domain-containing protein n=1 Tax=Obba rivulosa TaxID=1052685 RepID=A0A8E2DKF9_9APHY|nr:ACBP-domain-containing protein [Obba rivulosa]
MALDPESRQHIDDAQFDRAVDIVQSLPKTGPIQTGYEEKLDDMTCATAVGSLYKQATVGNVQPPLPSVWDMLGRAKWDAWAKHKDLDLYEAKWLYVNALLKVSHHGPFHSFQEDRRALSPGLAPIFGQDGRKGLSAGARVLQQRPEQLGAERYVFDQALSGHSHISFRVNNSFCTVQFSLFCFRFV